MMSASRATFIGITLLVLAGCSESQPSKAEGDTGGTGYPEDRVITGAVPDAGQAVDVDRNPAPQTSTGGTIPGGAARNGEDVVTPPRE